MHKSLALILLLFLNTLCFSQNQSKELHALRVNETLVIDGNLNESAWGQAAVASDFVVYDPNNGATPSQYTTVKVLYDNYALYIGAELNDSEPEKILRELSRRDITNINADQFYITLNPYSDGQNVFQFQVSAANVQSDLKITSSTSDLNWNAVWESGVATSDKGWTVEIKIPYSAIRFSNADVQNWDINFWRILRRERQLSSWNFVDKKLGNIAAQMGKLTEISNIKTPVRLSFLPYISGYADHFSETKNTSYSFNGGMDVKYGLSKSFTLDMTLIPDFSQTKSDEKVLNLSPYEVKYNENRQFFTEGTELFNKAGLFYSRRIGNIVSPYWQHKPEILNAGDSITEIPSEAKLINATKITGRNKNNLGIGFFNASCANTYAQALDSLGNNKKVLASPFINYNILVFDKTFGKYSYVNVINTNVYYHRINRVANVSGVNFKVFEPGNVYAISGTLAHNEKIKNGNSETNGNLADVNLGKMNGNLTYYYNAKIVTDKYDPNDLGYLQKNNYINHIANVSYQIFKPMGKILHFATYASASYQTLYSTGNFTSNSVNCGVDGTFSNYLSMGVHFSASPLNDHDYNETRIPGMYYRRPKYVSMDSWYSTDYRKRFAIDVNLNASKMETSEAGYYISIAPRIRVNDKFLVIYSISRNAELNSVGYATTNMGNSIFGLRDVVNITNSITGSYVFTNKASLTFSIRHYWSTVDYFRYYNIVENNLVENPYYAGIHDLNYNLFNIDMTYSWNFAPGSFVTIMWKNNISDGRTVYYNSFNSYGKNFDEMLQSGMLNSVSLKLSYYVDYQYLFKNKM